MSERKADVNTVALALTVLLVIAGFVYLAYLIFGTDKFSEPFHETGVHSVKYDDVTCAETDGGRLISCWETRRQ